MGVQGGTRGILCRLQYVITASTTHWESSKRVLLTPDQLDSQRIHAVVQTYCRVFPLQMVGRPARLAGLDTGRGWQARCQVVDTAGARDQRDYGADNANVAGGPVFGDSSQGFA